MAKAKKRKPGLLDLVQSLRPPRSREHWFDRLAPSVQAEIQVILEHKTAGKVQASWAMIGKELVKQLSLSVRPRQVAEDLAIMARE
jgi:hypothetical protein